MSDPAPDLASPSTVNPAVALLRPHGRARTWLLAGLLLAALVSPFLPSSAPAGLVLVLAEAQVVFALLHLATWTRPRTALIAFLAVFAVTFAAEAVGVATGAIFGYYRYSETLLGPLVLGVPPMVMLAYFALGYTSYIIARVIMCGGAAAFSERITGVRLLLTALLTGFLATLQDLAFDPIASTVKGQWVWLEDGAWFGVPAQNFTGWIATVSLVGIVLGVLLALPANAALAARPVPPVFMLQPVFLYAILAVPLVTNPLLGRDGEIYDAMAVVASVTLSIPILVAVALLTRPDLAPRAVAPVKRKISVVEESRTAGSPPAPADGSAPSAQ